MISDALRTDIERWAAHRNERALFHMARDGRLTQGMVAKYIANVTWAVRRGAVHLRNARDRSRELGDGALEGFFAHKVVEEAGHERWGEADLGSLVQRAAIPATAPSIVALDEYIAEIIQEDPRLYLTYLAFVEYVTVLIGAELLKNIEDHCGVSRGTMTVVDNHIELDRGHTEENFEVIDTIVADPRRLGPMRNALSRILAFFDAFCQEVTEASEDARPKHVSAA